MRQNYKIYPIDYIQELKNQGKRKKSRCFLEYWDDMEQSEHNSFGFYAKSWEVSKSTAHGYIKEFNDEIERFLAHWTIRNNQHYSYVKNQAERQPNETNASKDLKSGIQTSHIERLPNKALNINNNKSNVFLDKNFLRLYNRYRELYKFAGDRDKAYEEYLTIKDSIDTNIFLEAIIKYLTDKEIDGKYFNFANFIKEGVYLSYMPKRLEIRREDGVLKGLFSKEAETFITDDGKEMKLTIERFNELHSSGNLKFIDIGVPA